MNILVLFSYGSLRTIDDVAGFYDDIFHGHGTAEQIEKGVEKYRALEKAEALGSNTYRIGRFLAKRLQQITGEEWETFVANHHASPSIEEVAKECAEMDPKQVVTLGLTPFDSVTGKNAYERRFAKKFRAHHASATIVHAASFYDNQLFRNVIVDRAKTAKQWLKEEVRNKAEIVFTAHSKPGTAAAHQKMINEYNELAKHIATELPCEHYHIAYRSGQPAPQRWLGPDVLDVISELAERQVSAVIFIEVLSVIENLEAVEEVTKDAVAKARSLGMEAIQSEYLNDSADFVEALVDHLCSELEI